METHRDHAARVAEQRKVVANGPWVVNHRRMPSRSSYVRQIAKAEVQDCMVDLANARTARRSANFARLGTQLLRRSIRLNQTEQERKAIQDRQALFS